MALLPFFFAWVNSDQTTFDPHTMAVVDEDIFSMKLQHDEGQIPTLTIVIQNPYMGLLNNAAYQWAWFSYQSQLGVITPLFFGELVGIPDNLFGETITLNFIARSMQYIQLKQACAETLKVPGNYDPIFLDDAHRDEPDAILEGWSALYHVDRVTLDVTASDVLEGEDGLAVFEQADAFYDSVSLKVDQAPLTNVQVQAQVQWTQRSIGLVDGPDVNIASYTGDTFLSGWPAPGAGIGGGWSVETSFVDDVYQVGLTPMASLNTTWNNDDPTSDDCSTQSTSSSASWPALNSPGALSYTMTTQWQIGICNPYTNRDGEPGSYSVPSTVTLTGIVVPQWFLNCSWVLRYSAKRQYSELCVLDITANTQAILTSPTVEQDTQVIKITAADVGEVLIEYDAWTDFAGQEVSAGQLIYPNNPTTAGGLSYQACVVGGTAGENEPIFSDVPGTITYDGTVQWASLGESPLTTAAQWTPATPVGLGTVMCYEQQYFDANTGTLEFTGNSVFYLCVSPGTTNSVLTEITYIPPVTTSDEATPAPVDFFYIAGPALDTNTGDLVADGSVQWLSLGSVPYLGIPIGGSEENVTANNYFPTTRGQQSIEYMINKARAVIRMRSRAIKLSWDAPFELVMPLSCRYNAQLYDQRLPGGQATGKVTSYSLEADSTGKFIGHVEIGIPVGLGGAVADVGGDPVYVGTGSPLVNTYVNPGYQVYDGQMVNLPQDDIQYSPPIYQCYDDGLIFPLNFLPTPKNLSGGGGGFLTASTQGTEGISGSTAEQITVINAAAPISAMLAEEPILINPPPPQGVNTTTTGYTPAAAWWLADQQLYYTAQTVPYVMEANPVSYQTLIQPVTNGPFSGSYNITVSPLEIPMGINLSAPASGSP